MVTQLISSRDRIPFQTVTRIHCRQFLPVCALGHTALCCLSQCDDTHSTFGSQFPLLNKFLWSPFPCWIGEGAAAIFQCSCNCWSFSEGLSFLLIRQLSPPSHAPTRLTSFWFLAHSLLPSLSRMPFSFLFSLTTLIHLSVLNPIVISPRKPSWTSLTKWPSPYEELRAPLLNSTCPWEKAPCALFAHLCSWTSLDKCQWELNKHLLNE